MDNFHILVENNLEHGRKTNMKTRTTFRVNNNLHNLIKEKSYQLEWSYNKYLTNIVATYFRDGKDLDLERHFTQQHRQRIV